MLNQCQKLILNIQDEWLNTFKFDQSWQTEQLSPKENYTNRIMTSTGDVFEKAGIAMSQLHSNKLPPAASERYPKLTGKPFDVVGISLVLHPKNPHVPTVHANLRFFQCGSVWWFGGGMDLTPHYPVMEDCIHWHATLKKTCDQTDKTFYPTFKPWCDEYFYLKHRQQMRGIGGIFFDDINQLGFKPLLAFIKDLGQCFIDAYQPLVIKHMNQPYTAAEKNFQLHRRSRYAEFNLLYDSGTLFGVQFGGIIESILMSMPPMAAWHYQWETKPGTPEAQLDEYLQPKEWV